MKRVWGKLKSSCGCFGGDILKLNCDGFYQSSMYIFKSQQNRFMDSNPSRKRTLVCVLWDAHCSYVLSVWLSWSFKWVLSLLLWNCSVAVLLVWLGRRTLPILPAAAQCPLHWPMAVLAALVQGSGCCSVESARGGCLFLSGEGRGSCSPLSIVTTQQTCCASLQWGVRAETGWEERGRGLMEISVVGWTRNHKPWVIARLQRGKKAILSRPKPWLFCRLLCSGWHADFESPFQTPSVDCGWHWMVPWMLQCQAGGIPQDCFMLGFDLETETWKPALCLSFCRSAGLLWMSEPISE